MHKQSDFEREADNAVGKWCEASIKLGEVPGMVYILARNIVSLAACSNDPKKAIEAAKDAIARNSNLRRQ